MVPFKKVTVSFIKGLDPLFFTTDMNNVTQQTSKLHDDVRLMSGFIDRVYLFLPRSYYSCKPMKKGKRFSLIYKRFVTFRHMR